MNLKKIKQVALIQGGLGSEREVSLLSATAISTAFTQLNIPYTIIESDIHIATNLSQLKPDCAFLATHGKYAEDGTLQGICEYLKIPYTGSGILASAICMDKYFFKNYISKYKILTPDYQLFNFDHQTLKQVVIDIDFPVVIKPATQGSTIGISICKKKSELMPALKKALQYDKKILVEKYIEGMELSVSFLINKVLTPVEIIPKYGFYDYESKYLSTQTNYIIPPQLDKKIIEQCKNITQQIIPILNIKTYCRADFIIQNNMTPLILEVNTLPGLTTHSLLPKSAKYDGIDFNQLILKILQDANLNK